MTGELTVGSLFSGIGGLELGLERAGMRVVWQVEKDDYCRRVLAKHWPEVERFEDVRDVGAHNLKPVDLICGGFPCQDISNAGRRAGLIGERSGLWFEYARIIGELRPRYVVVENVSALLVRGLDAVLGSLSEVGYDAEWSCVTAESMGAPHRRERLFVLAYPQSNRRTRGGRRDKGRNHNPQGAIRLRVEPGRGRSSTGTQALAHPAGVRGEEGRQSQRAPTPHTRTGNAGVDGGWQTSSWWQSEPDVGRVVDGVPSRVDRLRALGNAVVPQVAEYIGRLIVEADKEMRGAA